MLGYPDGVSELLVEFADMICRNVTSVQAEDRAPLATKLRLTVEVFNSAVRYLQKKEFIGWIMDHGDNAGFFLRAVECTKAAERIVEVIELQREKERALESERKFQEERRVADRAAQDKRDKDQDSKNFRARIWTVVTGGIVAVLGALANHYLNPKP